MNSIRQNACKKGIFAITRRDRRSCIEYIYIYNIIYYICKLKKQSKKGCYTVVARGREKRSLVQYSTVLTRARHGISAYRTRNCIEENSCIYRV
jgi:hypothetical protein